MSEPATAVAQPGSGADPKSAASNISRGIQDKAAGKPPVPGSEPKKEGQPAAVPDPNSGKEKYVVDGKEIWLTPEQARAYTQKGIAFEPKVDQLHYLQKETQQFLQTLANDPLKILTDKRIGMTPEIVMEKVLASGQISDQLKELVGKWYYENVVAPMKMTPEQREAIENRKKLTEYEARESKAREMAIQQENKRRADAALDQLKVQIGEAMKESGLPDNDTPLGTFMARRVADVMRLAYFQKRTVTPKQAIEVVKSELRSFQTAFYDHLDEESLVKELGEKNAEKVKKYYLKLVKEAEKQPNVPKPDKPPTRNGERKTMNSDEFRDYLDNLKKQR